MWALRGGLDQRREVPAETSYTLTVSPGELYFESGLPCEDNIFNITTDTGNSWTITDNRTWITCSPTHGSGNATITVSCGTLTGTGIITIASDAPTAYIDVFNQTACI